MPRRVQASKGASRRRMRRACTNHGTGLSNEQFESRREPAVFVRRRNQPSSSLFAFCSSSVPVEAEFTLPEHRG
jgi:hypothetical protein